MKRTVSCLAQFFIGFYDILNIREFYRKNNFIFCQSKFLRFLYGQETGLNHTINKDFSIREWLLFFGIFFHIMLQQFLIQRTSIDSYPDRLIISYSKVDKLFEMFIIIGSCTYISRINPIFCQCLRHFRIFFEKYMSIEMEIADNRDIDSLIMELFDDFWDCFSRIFCIHSVTNEFN